MPYQESMYTYRCDHVASHRQRTPGVHTELLAAWNTEAADSRARYPARRSVILLVAFGGRRAGPSCDHRTYAQPSLCVRARNECFRVWDCHNDAFVVTGITAVGWNIVILEYIYSIAPNMKQFASLEVRMIFKVMEIRQT